MSLSVRSKVKRILDRVFQTQINNNSPGNCLLSNNQVNQLLLMPRFKKGCILTSIGELSYVDACTLVTCSSEIFAERCYQISSVNPKVIIDCGANIGLASIWFALNYPSASIYSFEADPNIYQVLKRNIDSLSLSKNINIYNSAIWHNNNGIDFIAEGGASGRVIESNGSCSCHPIVHVQSKSLIDILKSHESIDLLKIDIEGGENEIFSSLTPKDLKNVSHLFLEYHSFESSTQMLSDILNLFKQAGFRIYIKEARVPSNPFIQHEVCEGMDMQLNIYALRDA